MHWRFDPIFFIRVTHDKYVPEDDPKAGSYFWIEPDNETKHLMTSLNWLFKPVPNGAFISVKKNISSDGSEKVLGKLRKTTPFTFLLHLNSPEILLHTPPYDQGSSPLPAFSGRARVMYFDNLDDLNQPDRTVLSKLEKVGKEDLASIAPNKFRLQAGDINTSQIDFTEIVPGGSLVQTVNFSPEQRSALVELPSSPFRLNYTPPNRTEYLYTDKNLLGNNAVGVIRIYKDELMDYNTPVNYTIRFSTV
jgi:hypothetical protein